MQQPFYARLGANNAHGLLKSSAIFKCYITQTTSAQILINETFIMDIRMSMIVLNFANVGTRQALTLIMKVTRWNFRLYGKGSVFSNTV